MDGSPTRGERGQRWTGRWAGPPETDTGGWTPASHQTPDSQPGVVRIWFLGRSRIRIRPDPMYLITDISLS